MVIGLDCVPPALAFERFAAVMPTLSRLREQGTWGVLRSCTPPITVPAWASLFSGKDPGELGVYGFRNRSADGYSMHIADANAIKARMLWDELGENGRQACVIGVPPSYPPKMTRGAMVGCFLTPSAASEYTYPSELKAELEAHVGRYIVDIDERDAEPDRLMPKLLALSAQRFAIARHLWQTRQPDALMMVDISPDRLHHALWHAVDPLHASYDVRAYQDFENFYASVDQALGELVALADGDTTIVVASDHGARALRGGFCLNTWLIHEGYLVLKHDVPANTPLREEMVDWRQTRAWGEGGYYGRVFLNVQGREPQGCVRADDQETLVLEIKRALEAIKVSPHGSVRLEALQPKTTYREVRGVAPDLLLFVDALNYRALGTLGHADVWVPAKTQGLDRANHDWHGMCVMQGPGVAPTTFVPTLTFGELYRTMHSALKL